MKSVKFIKKYKPYIPGDVVDLDDKMAAELVAQGKAKVYASALPSVTVTAESREGASPSAD